MRDSLCFYHDNDGDLRGWSLMDPEVSCPCCRKTGLIQASVISSWIGKEKQHEEEGGEIFTFSTGKVRIIQTGDIWSCLSSEHKVFLLDGAMPSQEELLDVCGPHPFGGSMELKSPTEALVSCYKD